MAAELRLGVSFDLVYFRQQLQKLSRIASSEFTAPIKIKLDRQVVDQELNRLQKSFQRRTYTINIGDSAVSAARTRVVDLAKELANLRRAVTTAIVIPIKYETTGSAPGRGSGAVNRGVRSATASQSFVDQITDRRDLQKLYKFAKEAQLPFEQLANGGKSSAEELRRALGPAFRAVGKDAKAGLQAGLADSNSALAKAAAELGDTLLGTVKKRLGIASPSREFKKIGEDSGEGLEQGLKIGFGEASDVGVQEIEKLFKRLQKEAKAGSAVLQAIIAGSMSGIVQLPGMGQRGARGSIGPMIRQQRAQVQAERQAQTGGLAAYMLGMMSGVIPMGGTPRGAGGSIRGLIEQERAKVHERNRPQRIAGIIEALSSASGNLSPAAGVNQRLFTGGAVNPGLLSSGYIGRSAISPKFLNYPAGMPPAYSTGFIEPTAFGSLAAGTTGRYGMGLRDPRFPSSPLMTGGIGAGGGSFVPENAGRSVNRFSQSLSGLTEKVKGAAGVVRSVLMPTFGDMRKRVIDLNRSVAVSMGVENSPFYGKYMTPRGKVGLHNFPTQGVTAGPSSPLGVITAQSSMFGKYGPGGGWFGGFRNYGGGGGNPPNQPPNQPPGGGGGGGGFNFGGAASNIGNAVKNLPGKGLVREIGEEFGFAAKQVLLFGTTYKALAFLTSFPSQVGEAVGKLQSFRNTLNTISPSAEEAAQSNQFILSTVEKYNVPLDSAREGFTRLYASMQPAGFNGDEIRNLFSGISKAAATFGMSADKVDRVNYAFAQMASKGQIMSEELKGQLGDVLPGAMGIFAEAAGFKGPKAIQEFGKALEDGAFKGEAMRALIKNVGVELNKEFGPGAEGAARTFQGAMNRMQTSTKLLYEAFEPAAVGFLNLVVVPMTTGLKQVTEGFTQFFTGQKAVTEGGQALAQKLETLRPTFTGLVENAQKLAGGLGNVFTVFLGVAEAAIRFLSIPLVGSLASIYVQVQLLVGAFTLLGGRAIISAIASVIQFITSQALLLASLRASTIAMGQLSTSSLAYQTAMMQATAATQAFGSTLMTVMTRSVIGLALVAIGALIARIAQLRGQLGDISGDAKQMLDSVKMSAKHGLVDDTREGIGNLKDRLKTYKDIKSQLDKVTLKSSGGSAFSDRGAINTAGEVSSALAKQLVTLGVLQSTELTKSAGGYTILEARLQEVKQLVDQNITAFGEAADASGKFLDVAQKNKTKQAVIQQQDVQSLMGGGDGKDKKTSLESFYSLEDQLAKEFTQAELDRQQAIHDHRVALMKSYFDIQDARSNSYQKEAIQFERTMREIQLKKEGVLLAASREVLQAQGSVAGGVVIPGMVGRTGGAVNQDPTTRGRSSGPHLHAQGAGMSEQQLATLVDKYLDLGGRAASSYGRSRGAGGHGYNAIDFLTPQGTPISLKQGASISQYGPAGGRGGLMAQVTTPEGSFQLGHLSALSPAAAGAGVSAGTPRKVGANEKRDIVAQQKTQLAMAKESLMVRQAEEQAIKEAQVALESYIASILPTSEQELQNQLLEKKNQLIVSGLPEYMIEREMRLYEIQQKTGYGLAAITRLKEQGVYTDEEAAKAADRLNKGLAEQNRLIDQNTIALEKNRLAQETADIAKQMEFAGAGMRAGFIGPSARRYEEGRMRGESDETARQMASLTQELEMVQFAADSLENTALGIGDAFAQSFSDIITGAQTARAALGQFFSNIAKSFADMATQMIAKWLIMKAIGLVASMFPASAATQSVAPNIQSGGDFNLPGQISVGMATAANGAVWPGGFQAFASGGVVTGPTLGLVGEGRFNEAIVPLPDGKSIPVDLGNATGSNISTNIVVNVNNGQASSQMNGSGGQSLGRELEGAVRSVILKESRPGGIIYNQR